MKRGFSESYVGITDDISYLTTIGGWSSVVRS
jgi:hypothetical protein